VAAAPEPSPPEKAACVAAFDRGQRAQSDRALRKAQSELIACSQETCPAVLRADCAGVLADVRRALPTIVLAADDGHGHELADVRVTSGGEVLAESLTGLALPFDPGTFEVVFEAKGAPPVRVTAVIREGEKSRVVFASFPSLPRPGQAGARSGAGVGTVDRVGSPSRSAVGWVLPLGLAALGGGTLVFAGLTRSGFESDVDTLRGRCAPDCTQAERDDLSTQVVTANVALGIGVGLVVVAVASWFLTAPSATPAGKGTRARASALPPGTWAW